MSDERINKHVLKYAINKGSARVKNLPYRIISHLNNINCSEYSNIMSRISKFKMTRQIEVNMMAWGPLVILALLQVLANKLYKTYREKIFNTS